MKASYQMTEIPQSGVKVTVEGQLVRLLFDFSASNQEQEDIYECESVDVHSRARGDIIAAIINDRYSLDSVQAIMANYAEAIDPDSGVSPEKRAEHIAEYESYQTWRRHAKEVASIAISVLNA